ncbi:MAG: RNA methyltransferase [Bacteroidetes bacterium]|nr:RNA methyltransferase [Bacteroidota bacterium]
MQIPDSLAQSLHQQGQVDSLALQAAQAQPAPTSIRLNPAKAFCSFTLGEKVPWASAAYYLPKRPIFTADLLFHAGCYYVQEASSMFVEQALLQTLDVSKELTVLDACASPGGKSTLLASLLGANSLLLSNEAIATRVAPLVHNMAKWGSANSIVTHNDPKDFARLPSFFDAILVDAPCSGSGLFRKQADAAAHWSEENVHHCSLRQQRIVADLLPSLKENGILIYSTCSYSIEENENICDYLCESFALESLALQVPTSWGIVATHSKKYQAIGYRFFPHLLQGEGFFLACFRKKTTENFSEPKKQTSLFSKPSLLESTAAAQQFAQATAFHFSLFRNEIVGFSKEQTHNVQKIEACLKVKKMPLQVGVVKGNDFIPHPHLAYQQGLAPSTARVEADTQTAMKYVRKQPLTMHTEAKGFALLTFENQALGWIKNIGNRVNNYYPTEWRVLKETF